MPVTLQKIRNELNDIFFERRDLIDGALAAILAKEHILVIGPPGTAKSMLANEICKRVTGARYFQWLLTKFSTPEEIFGPISLKALEEDEYYRITEEKLPEAHIAFLDEIFKANSSILNALLTIIHERRFHNKGREEVPLFTLFGASNELPDEDELAALYDRFLMRFMVDYLAEDADFEAMLRLGEIGERTTIELKDIQRLQDKVSEVEVPEAIYRIMVTLRSRLQKESVIASDRRYRQSIRLLQAHALAQGREEVLDGDIMILKNVLWSDPSEIGVVENILDDLANPFDKKAEEFLQQAEEVKAYALREWRDEDERTKAAIEAHTKFKKIDTRITNVIKKALAEGRNTGRIEETRQEVQRMHDEILDSCLGLKDHIQKGL